MLTYVLMIFADLNLIDALGFNLKAKISHASSINEEFASSINEELVHPLAPAFLCKKMFQYKS